MNIFKKLEEVEGTTNTLNKLGMLAILLIFMIFMIVTTSELSGIYHSIGMIVYGVTAIAVTVFTFVVDTVTPNKWRWTLLIGSNLLLPILAINMVRVGYNQRNY